MVLELSTLHGVWVPLAGGWRWRVPERCWELRWVLSGRNLGYLAFRAGCRRTRPSLDHSPLNPSLDTVLMA